jgi:hypothetical protein
MESVFEIFGKTCCCVPWYDPQAKVLCNGLYDAVSTFVCMDNGYFLFLKKID